MCGACPPACGRRGTAEVQVAQGPAQAEPLGDGPLSRQGGLQLGPLSAAVEGQEVVLQQGIVCLLYTSDAADE